MARIFMGRLLHIWNFRDGIFSIGFIIVINVKTMMLEEERGIEIGCPTWARTRNQVINSHLLYH